MGDSLVTLGALQRVEAEGVFEKLSPWSPIGYGNGLDSGYVPIRRSDLQDCILSG